MIDSGAQPGVRIDSDPERQIETIIESAEKVAREIVVSAEREAEMYVDEVRQSADQEAADHAKRLAEMSDALIERAELLRRQSERLLDSIDAPGEPIEVSQDPTDVSAVAEEDDELVRRAFPTEEFSAGARLLATQMAVAGSGRQDIRDRLVNDFGIQDPEPLLDSIFGPG